VAPGTPKVLVSGASGLIGAAVSSGLKAAHYEVWGLTRRHAVKQQIQWDTKRPLDSELISGFDAVIHLAGENISGIWTAGKKRRIRQSRVMGTQNLAEALANAAQPPRVLIAASAVGYYGNRGDEMLTESSGPGVGFLPEVCREWEAAAQPASNAKIRTVHIRIGIVLSSAGGALQKMLPPFRVGLGGRIGSGKQWWSWIHIDDIVGAVLHILKDERLHGPVNLTAPNPVRNAEFAGNLGEALHRPAVLPLPAFAARLALGKAANELLLASAQVLPQKLQQGAYQFRYPLLRAALASIIDNS
jgi:uncharacterized protein